MRKPMALAVGFALLIATVAAATAIAAGERPITVRSGNVILTVNGNVHPSTLPKKTLAPVTFNPSGKISTADGSHPPALQEVILDAGPGGTIEAGRFPICAAQKLEARTTQEAEAACPGAIVGRGHTKVQVQFAESAPFDASGPLVLFNGGEEHGAAITLIEAYVPVPAPTAIVTKVLTTREHKGPYRLHVLAQIPKIASGAGSVTEFSMNVDRRGYLLANCNGGHFSTKVSAKFADGTFLEGSFLRPCRGV